MARSLILENIKKSYGDKVVLQDLSFPVEEGEFTVLVGPSGCGKSTVLRSIAGLENVDGGMIRIGERNVTEMKPKDRNIAMVFQDYALYPHKSVYENIAFGLRMRKFDEKEIGQRVREASEKLGLDSLLERRPGALSGGQRQRVAIGRAIVRKPDVFLFDEPLSNLDAKLRGSMRLSINRLHKDLKATIVYVTHDQVEAMTLADKIVVLDGGEIKQMGPPLDLYYYPANIFVGTFIGSPPMNLIEGELKKSSSGGLKFRSEKGLSFRISDEVYKTLNPDIKIGQKVVWGVRAENLVLGNEGPNVYSAKVLVVESLGAETQVLVDLAGHELNLKIPEPARPKVGDTLSLRWWADHVYLFDQETTETLVRRKG